MGKSKPRCHLGHRDRRHRKQDRKGPRKKQRVAVRSQLSQINKSNVGTLNTLDTRVLKKSSCRQMYGCEYTPNQSSVDNYINSYTLQELIHNYAPTISKSCSITEQFEQLIQVIPEHDKSSKLVKDMYKQFKRRGSCTPFRTHRSHKI